MITNLILAAILVLLIGTIVFGVVFAFRTYLRYRGQRLVTCPETHRSAAVHVDVAKVTSTKLIGRQEVRLDQCSRWPEKRNCGQECLAQVNADPEHCLVWNIVASWYNGKSCAYCQKPFGEIHWHDRRAALLSPDHIAKQWNEIPAEQLPNVFETYLPVCWNCYIAETYRRQNPDRVVNRNWERGAAGEYVPKNEEESKPQKRAAGR
ncbi:MAG: hypothetical protein WBR26_05370 [Candidatus Acidiferrum sp.]